MDKVAKQVERSSKTIHDHIKDHSEAISRSGFCPICRRVKSQYEGAQAVRRNS